MREQDSTKPKTKTSLGSSFLAQDEDRQDLQAFSNLMRKGVEDPDEDFDKVTQDIFDAIDAEDD